MDPDNLHTYTKCFEATRDESSGAKGEPFLELFRALGSTKPGGVNAYCKESATRMTSWYLGNHKPWEPPRMGSFMFLYADTF